MACRLVECDDPAVAHRPCCSLYCGDGIGLVMQNIASDDSVECRALGKGVIRRDNKFNPSKPGRESPRFGDFNRTYLTIECNNAAGIPDSFGKQHRYVSRSAADVEYLHPRPDAAFADQPSGNGFYDASLKLET